MSAASRIQSYVFWSTAQARQIVRNVLLKEPKIGMHHQQLFDEIVKQYPTEKLPKHLVPVQAEIPRTPPARGGAFVKPAPALGDHPVRSMRYLKKVILEDMLRLNEVERVIVTKDAKDKDSRRTRRKALYVNHSEPVGAEQIYRWRVVPGSEPSDEPDPDPKEMFETKRVEAWKKKVRERNKLLPLFQRMSTAHPPPPKRVIWQREKEAREKGFEYDPFSYDDSRQNTIARSGYSRSETPRQPPKSYDDTEGVGYDTDGRNAFSSPSWQNSSNNQDGDIYEDGEFAGFEDIDPEPASDVRDATETGEQAVYDALFAPSDSNVDTIEDEEGDDFTSTIKPYRRSSGRNEGSLNHRREFSVFAGQNANATAPDADLDTHPSTVTKSERAPDTRESLSVPPFPKFNEPEGPDLIEKERKRLQLWREVFRDGVEGKIQRMKQEAPANLMIKILENQDTLPQDSSENKPSEDGGPQINFLKHGIHSSVYVRPSKPRAPPKKPEPERWERDLPEDIQPPQIDPWQEISKESMSDVKLEGWSTTDDRATSTSRDEGADIHFVRSGEQNFALAYKRSGKPRAPRKEPGPERWERDLPEDILPPPIDTVEDNTRPGQSFDKAMVIGTTVGHRHDRASRLYESLARKALTGPYAVSRLVVERDPSTRPSKGNYFRSPAPRGPSETTGGNDPSREIKEEIDIDSLLD